MSLFGKKEDARTWDGKEASGTDKGIVGGIIEWSDTNEQLAYKYPYNNIKKGAIIKVHQNQKAVIFADGRRIDTLEPGRQVVVDSANLPLIGGLMNVATGGETSYRFEVWFLNVTTERELVWGFGPNDVIVSTPNLGLDGGLRFGMAGNGTYRIKLCNTDVFIDKLVGTEHSKSASEIEDFFKAQVASNLIAAIQLTSREKQYGPEELMGNRHELETIIRAKLNDFMPSQYGLDVVNFSFMGLTSPGYNAFLEEQQEGARKRAKLRQEGEFYHSERQYDIMQTAAGNEGAAGSMMGAGMGVGMGFGMGGAVGGMVQGMMQQNPAMGGQQAGAMPPPMPVEPQFFIAVNGQQTGPFGMEALRAQAAQGMFTPKSMVWTAGMSAWAVAESVPALGSLFAQTPPPMVPPAPKAE